VDGRRVSERIADLGESHHVTAFDAVYLALAEVTGARLLTFDHRLAAAPVTPVVEVVR
jgi:predicted nucleic acid-binding protein